MKAKKPKFPKTEFMNEFDKAYIFTHVAYDKTKDQILSGLKARSKDELKEMEKLVDFSLENKEYLKQSFEV